MVKIRVSMEAAKELEEAASWYEKQERGLGNRLMGAFEHAIQLLKEPNPPLTPVQGKAGILGGKKLILHRFPFSLITVQFDQMIIVVAFAHHSRKPGYWMERVNP